MASGEYPRVPSSSLLAAAFPPAEQLAEAVSLTFERARVAGVRVALLGGAAMSVYGSPRLTKDVDFVADGDVPVGKKLGRLTWGGKRYAAPNGIPVDIILRVDDYAPLYAAALDAAREERGVRVVPVEYLAAIKQASGRAKDNDDLVWLLEQPKLVNRKKARALVVKHLGGQFAGEEFDAFVLEADWRRHTDATDTKHRLPRRR